MFSWGIKAVQPADRFFDQGLRAEQAQELLWRRFPAQWPKSFTASPCQYQCIKNIRHRSNIAQDFSSTNDKGSRKLRWFAGKPSTE